MVGTATGKKLIIKIKEKEGRMERGLERKKGAGARERERGDTEKRERMREGGRW